MRALLEEISEQLANAPALDRESRNDARREARLLASAVLGCSPGDLARRMDAAVDVDITQAVRVAAMRRARGEPLAYAVGNAPFRHLTLSVDARVLIPRPETEIVVEQALRVTASSPGGIAVDIGTGSGAIALALATEGKFESVIATDISDDALDVARANAESVGSTTPIHFRHGADLAPLAGVRARVIVSNPPYIAYDEAAALPASVRDWEPASALFAADGGMARYKALLAGAAELLETDGFIVLELDANRAAETEALANAFGWRHVERIRDLSGRERVLVARAPAAQRAN